MSCFGVGKKRGGASDYLRPEGQWNTYSLGCCENCGNCLCCLFCCPCVMAELYHYTWSLPWWLALVLGILLLPFHMILVMVIRARVRWKHKLEGNLASDLFCIGSCCWPLVICQLRDQIHHLRSRGQWQLGYAREFGDTPPWLKPFVRFWHWVHKTQRTSTSAKQFDEDKATVKEPAGGTGVAKAGDSFTDEDESSEGASSDGDDDDDSDSDTDGDSSSSKDEEENTENRTPSRISV